MRHISAGWIEAHDGGWRVYSSVKARPPSSRSERERRSGSINGPSGAAFNPWQFLPPLAVAVKDYWPRWKKIRVEIRWTLRSDSIDWDERNHRSWGERAVKIGPRGILLGNGGSGEGMRKALFFFFFTRVVRCSLRGDEWEGDKGKR